MSRGSGANAPCQTRVPGGPLLLLLCSLVPALCFGSALDKLCALEQLPDDICQRWGQAASESGHVQCAVFPVGKPVTAEAADLQKLLVWRRTV